MKMHWILFNWELYSAKNMPLPASRNFNCDTALHVGRSSIFLTLRTKVDDFPNAAKLFGACSLVNRQFAPENALEFSSLLSWSWHVSCRILAMRVLID
jgi:hypothetical protein